MQYGMAAFAALSLLLTFLLQPETSQPGVRGVDKVRERGEKVGFVLLNPFKSLGMLRSPNVFIVVSALPVTLHT